MDKSWFILHLLAACAHLSYQKSTIDSPTYIAAVVEYSPIYLTNSAETLKANTKAYVKYIKTASLNNTDIIVFPEDGLTTIHLPERQQMEDWTTIIPNASLNYIPCIQDTIEVSETLKNISCAARDNEIYVVINIAEKVPCTDVSCPKDKMFYYNSNVAFDRTGKIIARYRKTNLFTEPQFNVTAIPEIVSFDTDFGVTFGTFICFDILFHEPALQLTRVHNVTDFVYPTAWFSEVPFLTAVQTQAGWSFAEDVNLLASGYNRPAGGNTGSGIYLGREGIAKAVFSKITHNEVLISEVPKIKGETKHHKKYHDHSNDQNQKDWYFLGKEHMHDELPKKRQDNIIVANSEIVFLYDNIQVFQTFPLERNAKETVCQNDFCCEFKVEIAEIDPNTKYRLAVFSGTRRYVVVDANIRACGVIQCLNDSISSCGSVQKSETVFNNIEITTTIHDYENHLIMPSTLNADIFPLKDWTFDERIQDNDVHVNIFLNNNTNNLVTFGIYVRNFNKNNSNRTSFCSINYFVILLVTFILSKF